MSLNRLRPGSAPVTGRAAPGGVPTQSRDGIVLASTAPTTNAIDPRRRLVLPTMSRGLMVSISVETGVPTETVSPTRQQLQHQPVQPVDRLGPRAAELVTTVDENPRRHQIGIDLDCTGSGCAARPSPPSAHPPDRSCGRCRWWTSAPAPQLRRHVHHRLAIVDQAVSDVFADAVAGLHRPDPIGTPTTRGEHRPVSGLAGCVPAHCETQWWRREGRHLTGRRIHE